MKVLVLNAGSSSLKYKLFVGGRSAASGEVERIGEAGEVKDHKEALEIVERSLVQTALFRSFRELDGVGHRVVHGGERFTDPTLIDRSVVDAIRSLIPLAPLHNPANLKGIEMMLRLAPDVPQVAVFDTAFHQRMPEEAFLYAIPMDMYERHGVRRYGFHGTSHRYVSKRAAEILGKPIEKLNLITLHLGNGASLCAVKGGKSIDTSMGYTPLAGLVMGTRCGDIDPEIPLLMEKMGMDAAKVLNEESGLKGLCGENDLRVIEKRSAEGDKKSMTALRVYIHRIRHYLGAYMVALGRVDAIVFTAGVGENSSIVREAVCGGLDSFGLQIDREKNFANETEISSLSSKIHVLVIRTDEEREIATQTEEVLKSTHPSPLGDTD